jgi:DNA-binding transcriptional LysR family regulator
MDLYPLKTFFTLSKVESFTKEAGLLFVTQSAVSHSIKKLETSLSTQLILRKGKTLVLSETGKALFKSCEKIFYEIEKADQDIAHYRKKAKFSIVIGPPVEFGTTILINHIGYFLATKISILIFFFFHHLLTSLMQDEVFMAIDCHDTNLPNLEKFHLFREQYVAIASPDFVLLNKIKTIDDLERVSILSNDKNLDWWNNFILRSLPKNSPFLKILFRPTM